MKDEERESIGEWFPEELSDEAAAAIYLFLEQFAQSFGQRYDQQIHRHWASCREDPEWRLPPEPNDDQNSSWEDDDIDF
jgi:hypothetical protein